jgi:LacI family transcriptional regulator
MAAKRQMSGIRELAETLGLSITTVSKAMHDYDDIAPATRLRVLAKAEELGYRPNAAARNLRRKSAEAIVALLPSDPNGLGPPLMLDLLASVGEALAIHGLDLMLATTRAGQSEEQQLARMIASRRADGLILFRTRGDDPRVDLLIERGVHFVTHGRTLRAERHAHVDGDGRTGFATATSRLIAGGRRRIALINGPAEMNFARLRREGARGALADAGLAPAADTTAMLTEIAAYEVARQMLNAPTRPDAFICCTDPMAIGAIRAIREAGFAPGVDIAVIGHDNQANGAFLDPPLSTMEIEDEHLGQRLADALVAMIGGGQPEDRQTVLPLRQVVRGTG